MTSKYNADFLQRREANFAPLSPVSFVQRAGRHYSGHPAIEYGDMVRSWGEVYDRCARFATALQSLGVEQDSTVAALVPNVPVAVELAYAVPMSGGVLNMINTRLDAAGIAFILDHGEAEVFVIDSGLVTVAEEALELASVKPTLIFADDPAAPGFRPEEAVDYEAFLSGAEPLAEKDMLPADEWDALALNYTSGTTGNPKGVVYSHRGGYLNAIGDAAAWSLKQNPRYLWTLPLFHCNGWCFPWTVAAYAGTNVCLRTPAADAIVDTILDKRVDHMCGAPIIVNMATTEAEKRGLTFDPPIQFMTAGAPPPAAVLQRAKEVGLDITHVYGLTEVYGPCTVCAWKSDWDDLPDDEQAAIRARQGINYIVLEELSVRDPETMEPVAQDGETMGEAMFRGNVVMKGYLKNRKATEDAFAGGHFHSGDLAVAHDDGYIELRDRSKDIIITGGENVSSIEVEGALYKHPAVSEAAVVAAPHEKWGETPVAFVELKEGSLAGEAELIAFTREHLAHFKCPTHVVFEELPRTSTGKIQKFVIRERAKALAQG